MRNYHQLHVPTELDNYTSVDGWYKHLQSELLANDFAKELFKDGATLIEFVDQKIEHARHVAIGSPLNRGEMLAVVLWTGLLVFTILSTHASQLTRIVQVLTASVATAFKKCRNLEIILRGNGLIYVCTPPLTNYRDMMKISAFLRGR